MAKPVNRRIFSAERPMLERQGFTAAETPAEPAPVVVAAVQAAVPREEFDRLHAAIEAVNRKIDGFMNLDHEEINRMKLEVAEIAQRIDGTKREIAQLRHPLAGDDKFSAASDELSAIVGQTEGATTLIFNNVEQVEEICHELQALVKDDYQMSRVNQIAECCTRIYENCSFQDLTGQRINKVVRTLSFIEDKVARMMEIWGHQEFETMPLPEGIARVDDGVELHGPGSPGGGGNASQDDIDALFD